MARNPQFDDAKRKLDRALQQLGSEEATPEPAAGDPPDQPGPAAPKSSASARVAPPRRRNANLPLRSSGAPAGQTAESAATDEAWSETDSDLAEQATPRVPATSPGQPAPPRTPEGQQPASASGPLAPTSEALVRLVVGAALLGLDGLAARSDAWEAQAGITRREHAPAASEGEIGSGRFRHALIGWVFETEQQLRPRGNPISWLRAVVSYVFGTVFSVVVDLLPLPRFGARRGRSAQAEPTDEDTRRWVARGRAEEQRSRRFAQAAIEDIVDNAIVYLARRPAVGRALGEIVRSPAMDDAVSQIVAGPVIEQALERVAASPGLDAMIVKVASSPALDEVIARVAKSPALDQAVTQIVHSPAIEEAVTHIVRTPAMEEAVKYLVGTKAMNEAIDTLSKSPALVELVTTQSTSVAVEIVEEVRERAVSGDKLAEGIVRRLLRRPPRSTLPEEALGIRVVEQPRLRRIRSGDSDEA